MVRVRFAPSPTGSLHVGSALTAVVNRRFADENGGVLLLRIDDTDAARGEAGSEKRIVQDLSWLGVHWDEGPVRQSERAERYAAAAAVLLREGCAVEQEDGALRWRGEHRPTLVRPGGSATYHLASVVDDGELAITHVIRGKDHQANASLHADIARALGHAPPEYMHHGLLVGPDGAKLSKRHGSTSLGELRDGGIPPEAVRRYLEELGLPRGDVHFDEARLARLAVEEIAALPDEELARRAGAPVAAAPALRGTRTLLEARELARTLASPPAPRATTSPETLLRFRELRGPADGDLDEGGARALLAAVRESGGDLRALRLALTGAERGPELWTVLLALGRDEALRRVDAALS